MKSKNHTQGEETVLMGGESNNFAIAIHVTRYGSVESMASPSAAREERIMSRCVHTKPS